MRVRDDTPIASTQPTSAQLTVTACVALTSDVLTVLTMIVPAGLCAADCHHPCRSATRRLDCADTRCADALSALRAYCTGLCTIKLIRGRLIPLPPVQCISSIVIELTLRGASIARPIPALLRRLPSQHLRGAHSGGHKGGRTVCHCSARDPRRRSGDRRADLADTLRRRSDTLIVLADCADVLTD